MQLHGIKMHLFWLIVVGVICAARNGSAIRCYHCHQTSKACNNGILSDILQKNCSEDKCAIMQYETQMPGAIKVIATIRDCASLTEKELLHMVSPNKSKLATIVKFVECNTHLCNSSMGQFRFKKNVFNVVMAVLLLLYLR